MKEKNGIRRKNNNDEQKTPSCCLGAEMDYYNYRNEHKLIA
jgi:hypothetical protein